MKKKALELALDLLIDKHIDRCEGFFIDHSASAGDDFDQEIHTTQELQALQVAIKDDNYDPIWRAVAETPRKNKKHKRKLKQLRNYLEAK